MYRPPLARLLTWLLPVLAAAAITPARAACDVAGLKLEDEIARKSELRESANQQTVRDLRTLRDAAVVLDALKFEVECEHLVSIVRKLAASPAKTIERSGDTDEEKAETIEETREPKAPKPY